MEGLAVRQLCLASHSRSLDSVLDGYVSTARSYDRHHLIFVGVFSPHQRTRPHNFVLVFRIVESRHSSLWSTNDDSEPPDSESQEDQGQDLANLIQ